ncbi:MAG TPA: site-2 protease family protein [Anaeromyxobacter sp.]
MQDLLIKVGSIVLLLGGLIFVHELGHFLVAKALRVKVLRFSIGFGPRLFGVRRGETEYRVSLLPLGGYVKMAGDDPAETLAPEDRGRGFLEQAPWKRFAIAVAGPLANLAFPAIIYFAVIAAQNGQPTPGPFVGSVAPESPAALAGLRPGDRIVSVAAPDAPPRPVRYFMDLRELVSPHPGEPLTFRVVRDGTEIPPLTIVPALDEDRDLVGEPTRRGVIGVTASYAPAVVAPVRPGTAGPLEPFDLVVAAAGRPVRHLGELTRAMERAPCAPLDLEVVRERPIDLPGATLAAYDTLKLAGVPTCSGGRPAFLPADPTISTFVAAVAPESPAAKAGIARGDAIASVNGAPVHTFRDVNALGREFKPGSVVKIGLADGRAVDLVPSTERYVDDLTKEEHERLVLGFFPDRRSAVDGRALVVEEVPFDLGVVEIAKLSWRELSEAIRMMVIGIAKIITGHISFKTVGGPIMLFRIASEAAQEGWGRFLQAMAVISVNLGLMNLLPIPVLDGGHIAQALLEGVTRRPLSTRAREIANVVGLVLLFTLMLFVFKNDIVRLMG